ncbi:hypothetical protein PInf_011906 [Phytophthora infestans]|nr:hypothetical protein PInf_011906 [Phytophthora infestans]
MGKHTERAKESPFKQQSMILVPMDTPGVQVVKPMHVFGYDDAPHGHMDMLFKDVAALRSLRIVLDLAVSTTSEADTRQPKEG